MDSSSAAPTSWSLTRGLLVGSVLLVVFVAAASGAVQAWSTRRQFTEAAHNQTRRLEAQAHEIGGMVSQLMAITSAASLRDNNYAVLGELARSVAQSNPNILRVQIFDTEGHSVADTAPQAGLPVARTAERARRPSSVSGRPVFEYQAPIVFAESGPPGLVVVSYSLEALQGELRVLEANKRSTLERTTFRTVVVGSVLAVVAALLAAYFSRRITRPIAQLSTEVLRLAAGDLQARVALSAAGAQEVEALGSAFNHMADRIAHLMSDVAAKARLEREVDLARTVQETLLPPLEAFSVGPYRVAGRVAPAELVAGDWWIRTVVGRKLIVAIGDVTGHGLSTALIANTAVSGFMASLRGRTDEALRAGALMQVLNQTLYAAGKGGYQMSAALAVFDLDQGEVDCAGGAHPFPCLYSRAEGRITSLVLRGPLLGQKDHAEFTSRVVKLKAGDLLIAYTDGLSEARDSTGRPYGLPALTTSIQRHGRLSVERLRDGLLADVKAHAGAVATDDITVVVTELNGSTQRS